MANVPGELIKINQIAESYYNVDLVTDKPIGDWFDRTIHMGEGVQSTLETGAGVGWTKVAVTSKLKKFVGRNVAANDGIKIPNSQLSKPPPQRGKPPIGNDGYPIELHHRNQIPDGPLDEMTRTDHRLGDNYKINHSNTGDSPSLINRSEFNKQRGEYWRREVDSGRFDDMPD